VSGSRLEVVDGGDGGVGDTARIVVGARIVGGPDDVRFRFSVCCWQKGVPGQFPVVLAS
jgi:hypothetical protein